MTFVNPFKAVTVEEYEALQGFSLVLLLLLADAGREIATLRGEVAREVQNGVRLTELAARAVRAAEIYEDKLVERQIGVAKQGDPSLVLVANLPPQAEKKQQGYVPLSKRRRVAKREEDARQVRRNALPKVKAELPAVPLTQADRLAMREAVAELSQESNKP